ncbi:hypothetical protein F383_27687 [Gossypium arboreum]|uniref:Uncharacterized protein n=1 Tax=Gossypium arboreum TaxID=29729 RepID=A0A0B0P7C3_GOSAR|nr:hypothetical protein F383_27687 [Gossypium arboreum]
MATRHDRLLGCGILSLIHRVPKGTHGCVT